MFAKQEDSMTQPIGPERAREDLSIIRETIDRSTGSRFLADFIRTQASLFILFGILGCVGCLVHWYALLRYPTSPATLPIIAGMWSAIMAFTGVIKVRGFFRRSKAFNMDFLTYYRNLTHFSFFQVYLPVGLAGIILFILFIKIGLWQHIVPIIVVIMGIIINSLSVFFIDKRLNLTGYFYILLGGAGLLFFDGALLLFCGMVFLSFTVLGSLLHLYGGFQE